MNIKRMLPLILLIAAGPGRTVGASGPGNPLQDQGGAVSSLVTAVSVQVQVHDRQGNLITGLGKTNFLLREDGKEREIIFAGTDSEPVSVVLLMEFNRNTGGIHQELRDAGHLLVNGLRPGDHCALVTYSSSTNLLEDFTADRARLVNRLAGLQFTSQGGVSLLSSIDFLLDRMEKIEGKKAIVVMGTGLSEQIKDEKRFYRRLQSLAIPVFALSLGQHVRNALGQNLAEFSQARFFQADHRLRQLAEKSGGAAFFPLSPGEFPKICRKLLIFLQAQYLVAYRPDHPEDLARLRKIEIEARADLDRDGKPELLRTTHTPAITLANRR